MELNNLINSRKRIKFHFNLIYSLYPLIWTFILKLTRNGFGFTHMEAKNNKMLFNSRNNWITIAPSMFTNSKQGLDNNMGNTQMKFLKTQSRHKQKRWLCFIHATQWREKRNIPVPLDKLCVKVHALRRMRERWGLSTRLSRHQDGSSPLLWTTRVSPPPM